MKAQRQQDSFIEYLVKTGTIVVGRQHFWGNVTPLDLAPFRLDIDAIPIFDNLGRFGGYEKRPAWFRFKEISSNGQFVFVEGLDRKLPATKSPVILSSLEFFKLWERSRMSDREFAKYTSSPVSGEIKFFKKGVPS